MYQFVWVAVEANSEPRDSWDEPSTPPVHLRRLRKGVDSSASIVTVGRALSLKNMDGSFDDYKEDPNANDQVDSMSAQVIDSFLNVDEAHLCDPELVAQLEAINKRRQQIMDIFPDAEDPMELTAVHGMSSVAI